MYLLNLKFLIDACSGRVASGGPVQDDASTGIELLQTGEDGDRRGLAGTVAPEEAGDHSGPNA